MTLRLALHGLMAVIASSFVGAARAEIYRWDTGEVIAGTEGVEPRPGIHLRGFDLQYAALSGLDFSNADLHGSNLSHADLSDSTFTNAQLSGTRVTGVNFQNARIVGAAFQETTSRDFTKEQLYSTASYQERNLQGLDLAWFNDLTNWDFSGQDLTRANFTLSTMTDVDLTGASVVGASFAGARGFEKDQLYSTASYRAGRLSRIHLGQLDLSGWDFSQQDLHNAILHISSLAGANLSGANLTGADLSLAGLDEASFDDAVIAGTRLFKAEPTQEQIYSTASYRDRDMYGVDFSHNDLTGWDLRGQNLSFATFVESSLSSADLSGANLSTANLLVAGGRLDDVNFDSTTVYNQWTLFPPDFNPVDAGLTFVPSIFGDFDINGTLDTADVQLLEQQIRIGTAPDVWPVSIFDVNRDGALIENDVLHWIQHIRRSWVGDANVDGVFDAEDLSLVIAAGEYEDDVVGNSVWATGDFNGDREFTSADLLAAIFAGGYERGTRSDFAPALVPEPTSLGLLLLGLVWGLRIRHARSALTCLSLSLPIGLTFAVDVSGGVTLVSQTRSISATATVCLEGPVNSSMMSTAQLGDFMASVSESMGTHESGAGGGLCVLQSDASAGAEQNSEVSLSEIQATGSARAGMSPADEIGSASSSSELSVSFEVDAATSYSLTGVVAGESVSSGGFFPGSAQVELTFGETVLHSVRPRAPDPVLGGGTENPFSLSGTLTPGTYTLRATAQASRSWGIEGSSESRFNVRFVPEPASPFAIPIAATAIAFRARRRTRHSLGTHS